MKMKYLLTGFILISISLQSIYAQAKEKIEDLVQNHFAVITLSHLTKNSEFIRFPADKRMELSAATLPEKVTEFLDSYGEVLGVKDAATELILRKTETDFIGHQHLFFEQFYNNLPVFGGDLRFHFDENDKLAAINGAFIPNIKVDTSPHLAVAEIENIGLNRVEEQGENHSGATLAILSSKLYIFQKGLVQGFKGSIHLAYEVEIGNRGDVLEYVYIDAHKGTVVEQFTGIHDLLARRLYETNTSNQIWAEGDAFPGALDIWQQNEVETAGQTYHFFNNTFGFTSYDGADAEMRTINNNPAISCPNANWNGSTTNYCTGTASDDVVGHEWGHAYTSHTSKLIYAWQSGALNESYSDIWGETIDLINLYQDTGEDLSNRSACNSSDRWMMGEDATAFGSPIRDMWNPNCKSDAGKVTDGQYYCGTGDSGGVHSNSGVNNHAYALLVDGGTYNGETITGLGFTKAAHIFWRSQRFYLTKTSGFPEQADALEAACSDLLGIDLEGLSTTLAPAGLSGEMITLADCVEVADVINAVELRTDPGCGFAPMLAPNPPALCAGALLVQTIFTDDFESGIGGWKVSQVPTNPSSWDAHDWEIIGSLPDGRTGNGMYGADLLVGDCNMDLENGILRLESPLISIPAAATSPVKLAFEHYVSLELKWDGGNLKSQVNGGAWNLVPSSAFIFNPYNETINAGSNDNPMAGEDAFTGSDGGSSSGSWGQSQINLSLLTVPAAGGDDIMFRWELGTDGCNGWDGWYLDDIIVCSCETVLPIELTSFSARPQKNDILLHWETASEQNNLGFELQRSLHSSVFETIAWVDGAINSTQYESYSYIDRNLLKNVNYYYRLRQLDVDGKATFSTIISAKVEDENDWDIAISPNPVTNLLHLSFIGNKANSLTISIINLNGKVVFEQKVLGNETFNLNITTFSAGIYFAKFTNKTEVLVKAFVVE